MIKDLAWKTFKNTGDINTFLELMKIENTEKEIKANAEFAVFNDNFIPTNIDYADIKNHENIQTNKRNTL